MNAKKTNLSRRGFFKTSTLAATAIIGSASLATQAQAANSSNTSSASKAQATHQTTNKSSQLRGRMFFTTDVDFKVLSAAVERIFPADDLGPGAIALAVPYFIDNQLAGAYGNNDREYMQGPFEKGLPTQGYQTPLIRQQIFKQGVEALQSESLKRYKKNFFDLKGSDQDKILSDFEANKVALRGVDASYFFELLREMTLCGVYADPIYNGNDAMNGWKMKEYPGAQMSYLAFIDDDNFQKIPPMSLADMQGEN